jgi:hypothetical protein
MSEVRENDAGAGFFGTVPGQPRATPDAVRTGTQTAAQASVPRRGSGTLLPDPRRKPPRIIGGVKPVVIHLMKTETLFMDNVDYP